MIEFLQYLELVLLIGLVGFAAGVFVTLRFLPRLRELLDAMTPQTPEPETAQEPAQKKERPAQEARNDPDGSIPIQ